MPDNSTFKMTAPVMKYGSRQVVVYFQSIDLGADYHIPARGLTEPMRFERLWERDLVRLKPF